MHLINSVCSVTCCFPLLGPPTDVADPLKMFEVLREEWENSSSIDAAAGLPRADSANPAAAGTWQGSTDRVTVVASSFDAFVDAVWDALPTLNLTVFTGEPLTILNAQCRVAC